MNSAQRVIEKFGGQSNLAALLGKTQSTVQYWAKVGRIPVRWHVKLLNLANQNGINLRHQDFIEIPTIEGTSADYDAKSSLPIALWPGVLRIGQADLPVFVLNNRSRVLSRNAATTVLTGKRSGDLESYLNVAALADYLPENLAGQLIEFVLQEQEKIMIGISAETFLDICRAYVYALNDGNLQTPRQKAIATKAGMFLASCAKVGLDALIDEATGYQYVRDETDLQFRLNLYLEKEMRKWERTFPEGLWIQFGRLTYWKGPIAQRPKYWGKLVMELIYGYLEPDVAKWLRENNPEPRKGRNHHQWLNENYGLKRLLEHINQVIGMARGCKTMPELRRKMAESYGHAPIQYTLFDFDEDITNPSNKKKRPIDASPVVSTEKNDNQLSFGF